MRQCITLFLLIVSGVMLHAQTAVRVAGKIQDPEQKQGVPFARVVVNQHAAYAGEDGLFSIEIPWAATYTVEVEQIGYETATQTFQELPSGGLLIELKARPVWLSEILVAGQKRPGFAQSTILEDDAKRNTQPRDIGDLLNDVPGFAIVKRGGYALDPVFRGFKYEQLNVVYDGGLELTHACPNRMDPTTTHINPQDIEKIELIRGPFSMRYGPSMAGTINIVTENPFTKGIQGFGGSIDAGYEFNGNGKMTRMVLHQQSEKLFLSGAAGIKDYGNYTSGSGLVIPTSFKSWDYDLKAGVVLSPEHQIQVSWRQSFTRDVLHVGLMMDTDYDNSSIASLDYRWKNTGSILHELNVKIYGSFVDHQMSNTKRPAFKSSGAVANVDATTLGGRIEATLLANQRQWWFIGTDLRYVGREGNRVRTQKLNAMTGEPLPKPLTFVDTLWPDASLTNIGAFVEGRRILNERWTLLAGLRTDLVQADAKRVESDFIKLYGSDVTPDPLVNLSGTISVAWQPGESSNVQLALGRGVRAPNMIERYINHFNIGSDGFEYVGDPFLKPEINHQAELSWSASGRIWEWRAQAFYAHVNNFITSQVDSTIKRKFMPMAQPRVARRFINIDAAQQIGFEVLGGIDLMKGLRLSATLSYTYARDIQREEPLPEIAPLESTQSLRYQTSSWWVEMKNRIVAAQNRVSARFAEPATPGFQTVDLRAGTTLFDHLTLGAGVLNIFDVQYREHLNRAYTNWTEQGVIYEPGRNISAFLKYAF